MRSQRRRWFFRLLGLTVIPFLALGAVEGLLYLSGYGYPTSFFVPAAEGEPGRLRENPNFGWRFFPPSLARAPLPTILRAEKRPGARRIFVLGESAAKGEPEPAYGFARVLEVLLEGRFPGRDFEVVNVAMTAINSHAVLAIARDCARLEGDVWVLYMGNNEVMGPFGPGSAFGAQALNLQLVRASLALKATRLGQLIQSVLGPAGKGSTPETWGGMEMFLEHQVRRDDPRMESVYAHFSQNLADILGAAAEKGIKIVLSTVVTNLKDCPPFGSLHAVGSTQAQVAEWEKRFRGGWELEAAGDFAGAAARFEEALRADAEHAELHFRLARCRAELGDHEAARRHYLAARDLDTLRFRADTRINEIIRQQAAGREHQGIRLVHAERRFAEKSPHEVAGEESFHEHVHLTFEGNYLLAKLLAEAVAEALSAAAGEGSVWPDLEHCARRLALTPWARRSVIETMRRRLSKPPYNRQFNHGDRDRRLREALARFEAEGRAAGFENQAAIYREALAAAPEDWFLHDQFASFLEAHNKDADAAAELEKVMGLVPHHFVAEYKLGVLFLEGPTAAVAEKHFREAIRLRPDFLQAIHGLGSSLAARGNHEEACREFERALALAPDYCDAHLSWAESLAALGRTDEAALRLEAALKIEPENAAARLGLASLRAKQGKRSEATAEYAEAVRLQPWNAKARLELGNALTAEEKFVEALSQYSEAARLKPDDHEARYQLAAALARKGDLAEAEAQLAETVRLRPDLPQAHLSLGIVLMKQAKLAQAIESLSEARRLDPANPVVLKYLEEVRALQGGAEGKSSGAGGAGAARE